MNPADAHGEVSKPASMTLDTTKTGENPYWLAARDTNPSTVRFADFLESYEPLREVANVRSFVKQVTAFQLFTASISAQQRPTRDGAPSNKADLGDRDLFIALGKCLATIAYGQLVAENCLIAEVASTAVSIMFHGLIEDLSAEALGLAAMFPSGSAQRAHFCVSSGCPASLKR